MNIIDLIRHWTGAPGTGRTGKICVASGQPKCKKTPFLACLIIQFFKVQKSSDLYRYSAVLGECG